MILSTRYATSNAIHQMGKLPRNQWEDYLHWIEDFEYTKLGLPAPDLVIFLDMNRAVADRLLSERYAGDESKRDIHEKNMAYLQHCRETAEFAGQYWGWKKVSCDDGNAPRPVEEITGQILQLIDEAGL